MSMEQGNLINVQRQGYKLLDHLQSKHAMGKNYKTSNCKITSIHNFEECKTETSYQYYCTKHSCLFSF